MSKAVDSRKKGDGLPGGNAEGKPGKLKKTDGGEKKRAILVEALVHASEMDTLLFQDQHGRAYAAIRVEGHREVWPVRGRKFQVWLAGMIWRRQRKAPTQMLLSMGTAIFEAEALHSGVKYVLHNRVAWREEAIWYDLSDERWRAVKITPDGWEVVDEPPILFRRYGHQSPQVEPVHGGKPRKFLELTTVKNEDDKILLIVAMGSYLIPEFPHPVLVLHGPQGSAKSTLFRLVKELVDPSSVKTLSFPKDVEGAVHLLSHHWFVPFDNITSLRPWLSDAVSRAVTGDGFQKRELYTDDDTVLYQYQRCVGLNGINIVVKKPDLLDRSVLIELERISKEERRTERWLQAEFKKKKATILGGFLDALSRAMAEKERVEIKELPRMADFAEWGEAFARALGYGEGVFLGAYLRNITAQHFEAIIAHPVGQALLDLMKDRVEWSGTACELLAVLEERAEGLKIDTKKTKGWPKAANILSRRINELKTNLAEEGLEVVFDHNHTNRLITIRRTEGENSDPCKEKGATHDATLRNYDTPGATVRYDTENVSSRGETLAEDAIECVRDDATISPRSLTPNKNMVDGEGEKRGVESRGCGANSVASSHPPDARAPYHDSGDRNRDATENGIVAEASVSSRPGETIPEFIARRCAETGKKSVPHYDILQAFGGKSVPPEEVEKKLEYHNRMGDIFEAKRGFWMCM